MEPFIDFGGFEWLAAVVVGFLFKRVRAGARAIRDVAVQHARGAPLSTAPVVTPSARTCEHRAEP